MAQNVSQNVELITSGLMLLLEQGIHKRFISGYTFDTAARLLDVQHSDAHPDQASDRLLPVQVKVAAIQTLSQQSKLNFV